MIDVLVHLDEDGRPCARHPPANLDALLALAVLGTRHAGFNHDIASKLQGMMMSLDEIVESELVAAVPELRRIAESALTAAQELAQLLDLNRALAKTTAVAKTSLRELLVHAGERVGVTVRGEIVEATLVVPVASMTHALALVLDATAGPGRGRQIDAVTTWVGDAVQIDLPVAAPAPGNASELVTLSRVVLQREGGELRCRARDGRLVVRMPAA